MTKRFQAARQMRNLKSFCLSMQAMTDFNACYLYYLDHDQSN